MAGATVAAAISAQGPKAPAFRIRTQVPHAALAEHGVEVRALPLFTASQAARFASAAAPVRAGVLLQARMHLARRLEALDGGAVAWIQRQADMLPSRRLERLAMSGRRVVLDVDDAVWHDTHPSAHGHRLAFLKDSARKAAWLAGSADAVIAGNDMLAEWLSAHARDVRVIPSLVDTDAFAPRTHAPAEAVVWGWIGSRSTAPHLHALADRLARAARALDGIAVELVVVGAGAPRVPGVTVTEVEWSERSEREQLARFDVGLMPLEDSVWTRGKCAYKALQYMAGGVPVVADDVGVSAQVIGHDRGGIVAGGPGEWVDALVGLSRDDRLRARLGAEGRSRVVDGFSLRRWAPELAGLLSGSR